MAQPVKILIVGNGFGGVYTLKRLHKIFHRNKNIEFSLIGDSNYFLFTPLLHEVATGGISPENIIEPIRKVLGCCLKNFYIGKAESVDLTNRGVKVGNFVLPYDYLVLSPGSQTNFHDVPGAKEHSLTLKSLNDAIKIKNHCIAQMEHASHLAHDEEIRRALNFVLVGGGPTGVELAAELRELITENFNHYYSKHLIDFSSVTIIQNGPELMTQFDKKIRNKSLEKLREKGMKVILNSTVKEVTANKVLLEDKTEIPTETVIWVAGVKPNKIEFDQEIPMSSDGRLFVNEYLQLPDHKNVFVIGDSANIKDNKTGAPLPALAQVAEKQAKTLAKNIKLSIQNKKLEAFSYYHLGSLVSLGRWMAVGQILNINFYGRTAWWLWRTVYLSKLISMRKKIKVAIDWTINIFSPRDISQF